MTSTDIALRDSNGHIAERDVVDGWAAMLGPVAEYANQISRTDFVPKVLRGNTAAVTACIMTGREMGLGPMLSLKVIHMVEGQPTLSAEYKRARALEAGHEITYDETTITRCVVRGRRRGTTDWTTVTWSMDDAKRAKLDGRPNYRLHPRRQLEARATGELCDLIFADCTYGLATLEVIEDGDDYEREIPPTETPAPPAPAQRTAQRKTRAPKTPAAAVPPAAAGHQLPPLPGEEPDETDYDSFGTVTKDQLTALWATFTTDFGFGKDDKAKARETVEQLIGRKLIGGTTGNLSRNEASTATDILKQCGTRDRLLALLATGELPDEDR
jgi:hypothetical protein